MGIIFAKLGKLFEKSWAQTDAMIDESNSCSNCRPPSKSSQTPFQGKTHSLCRFCEFKLELKDRLKREFESRVLPEVVQTVEQLLGEQTEKDTQDFEQCQKFLKAVKGKIWNLNENIESTAEMIKKLKGKMEAEKQGRVQLLKVVDNLGTFVSLLEEQFDLEEGGSY